MFSKVLILALAASPLVAAHGRIDVVTGDKGGNGTALAIRGGIVPGPGPNSKTEVDTTIFRKKDILTDGLGRTKGSGNNRLEMLAKAMELSGNTLPQVSNDGNGSITGTFHIVTSDGAGPIKAVLDPTGTGAFSNGVMLETKQQVPGHNGFVTKQIKEAVAANRQNANKNKNKNKNNNQNNNNKNNNQNNKNNNQNNKNNNQNNNNNNNNNNQGRSLWDRAADAVQSFNILKRATNVNMNFPMAFSVPAGTTCTGTVNGIKNVCLVKIANANRNGPFGGVIAVQMAGNGQAVPVAGGAAAAGTAAGAAAGNANGNAAGNANGNAAGNAKGNGNGKREVPFSA